MIIPWRGTNTEETKMYFDKCQSSVVIVSLKTKTVALPGKCSFSCESVSCSVMSDSLPPMDYSPPGPSVHGILQGSILEWVAVPFCRSKQVSPTLAGEFCTV